MIGLSQSTYLDKILKKFKMDQSKKGFLPVLQGVKLSKTQNPTTAEDRERMKITPYASVIGSIKYVMLCTRPVVCLAMSLARGYNSDPSWITGSGQNCRTKEIFLGYGGDKKFIVKGYVDARFGTDPDDSKSQSGYILKVRAIS